jgi:hypothetical protein
MGAPTGDSWRTGAGWQGFYQARYFAADAGCGCDNANPCTTRIQFYGPGTVGWESWPTPVQEASVEYLGRTVLPGLGVDLADAGLRLAGSTRCTRTYDTATCQARFYDCVYSRYPVASGGPELRTPATVVTSDGGVSGDITLIVTAEDGGMLFNCGYRLSITSQ